MGHRGVRGTTRDGERNRAASPAVPFRKYQNVVDVGRCLYHSLVCDLPKFSWKVEQW